MAEDMAIRPEDLRRWLGRLFHAAGLAPERALGLAGHLLWYNAAGADHYGVTHAPAWVERLTHRHVDPRAEGRVGPEHTATALIDGQSGPGPLLLHSAATIAGQKAREIGVGLVRLTHVAHAGPAADVAADLALGPFAACVVGPGPSWSLAVPSPEGLPLLVSTDLAPRNGEPLRTGKKGRMRDIVALLGPLGTILAGEPDGWLVAAVSIAAFESLSSFHERVAEMLAREPAVDAPVLLRPDVWERHRRHLREHGVRLRRRDWDTLRAEATRLGLPDSECPHP